MYEIEETDRLVDFVPFCTAGSIPATHQTPRINCYISHASVDRSLSCAAAPITAPATYFMRQADKLQGQLSRTDDLGHEPT